VLNAHRFSAARRSLPLGWPRVLVNIAVVTAVRASAWVRLVVAATRGHSLTIDHGWREVAETALTFVKRFI
jgi:non-heme chloroperoxidase